MLLNEIFDKLTPSENVQTHADDDETYSYRWTTKSGNRVNLTLDRVDRWGAYDVMFLVNGNIHADTGRDKDQEILSSIFFKLREIIQDKPTIKTLQIDAIEGADDYTGYEDIFNEIKEYANKNFDREDSSNLLEWLPSFIKNKKIDKYEIQFRNSYFVPYMRASDEVKNGLVELLNKLKFLDPSNIKGQNRRLKLYLYAIKKYLPNWTANVKGNVIRVSKFEN